MSLHNQCLKWGLAALVVLGGGHAWADPTPVAAADVTGPKQKLTTDTKVQTPEAPHRLGKITVKGNKYYSSDFIQRFMKPVRDQQTVDVTTLQHCLLTLNDFSDLRVKAVLMQGEVPGTTDVELDVNDTRPFHGSFDYNNFGTAFTGQNRAGVTMQWGNMGPEGSMLLLRGAYPFPAVNPVPFFQGQYAFPINSRDDQIGLQYASGQFTVGQELEALNIVGQSTIEGLTYDHPLLRTVNKKTDLNFAFYSKSFKNFILDQQSSQDEVRELVAGYGASMFPGNGRALNYSVSVTEGLGTSLGGSANGLATNSRVGAGDSFTKLSADAFTAYRLGQSKNYLILRGSGQYSFGQPLVIGEQYALGGPDTVRGYVQGQVLADTGYSVSAELRVPMDTKQTLQGVVFFDTGGGELYKPQNGEQGFVSLTGAGIGMRAQVFHDSDIRVDWGFPLSNSLSHSDNNSQIYGQFVTHF